MGVAETVLLWLLRMAQHGAANTGGRPELLTQMKITYMCVCGVAAAALWRVMMRELSEISDLQARIKLLSAWKSRPFWR